MASQSARWGLLGKGAMLTVSSQPGRTSPVIRGHWVLRICSACRRRIRQPNVPALKAKTADAAGNAQAADRCASRWSQHRGDPQCAGCHKMMDPIGFALEPFDADRPCAHAQTRPVRSMRTSEMYDGTPVDGPAGVRDFLLKYQDQYVRNVTQNLLTYALGRGVEYDDMPTVRNIVHDLGAATATSSRRSSKR